MWNYIKMFITALLAMVLVPACFGIAAGVLFLYGYGIWWVFMWVIRLF